jgi:hypothetical protein
LIDTAMNAAQGWKRGGLLAMTTSCKRSWLDDRKPGEHFSTFKLNSGGVN